MLLASETVTNAFRHFRSDARVTVIGMPGLPLMEVADDNSRHRELRAQDLDAIDGRSLSIVELLAAPWGVRDDPFGKTVWFEVRAAA